MGNSPETRRRKPWIIPAKTDALEPADIANTYSVGQDSNPLDNNDAPPPS